MSLGTKVPKSRRKRIRVPSTHFKILNPKPLVLLEYFLDVSSRILKMGESMEETKSILKESKNSKEKKVKLQKMRTFLRLKSSASILRKTTIAL